MSIDNLRNMTLTESDFNEQTQFIVDDFIAEKMLPRIYADGVLWKSKKLGGVFTYRLIA